MAGDLNAWTPTPSDSDLVEIARGRRLSDLYRKKVERRATVQFYLRVFAPFALGHFISYILRSINSVLAPRLISDLSLNAAQIGLLTSAYFLAFAASQLPVGLALDRYGPRRVQTVLLPIAAAGCVWFSLAQGFTGLVCARLVTGVGLSACFMSSLKAVSEWRPRSRMPSLNGYFLAVGGLGAMASTVPVQWAAELMGWRDLFVALALAIAAAACLIVFASPEKEELRRAKTRTDVRSLAAIYRDAAFRRTISVALIPHAAFFAVQGLWFGAWLDQALRLPRQVVGLYLFCGMAAMVVGAVAVGKFVELARRFGLAALDVAAGGLWIFALIQALLIWKGPAYVAPIALAFPFFGGFAGLEFAIVAQSVEPEQAGRASTCLNLLVFSGSFLLQAGFGAALGLFQRLAPGASVIASYRFAFALLLLAQLPGLAFWAFRKVVRLSFDRKKA